jgi:hypothetical protein
MVDDSAQRTIGSCPVCGQLKFIGPSFGESCEQCAKSERQLERAAEKSRRHRERRAAAGLCACGDARSAGRNTCEACLYAKRLSDRRQRQEHPELSRSYQRRWRQTETGKRSAAETQRRYVEGHLEHAKAIRKDWWEREENRPKLALYLRRSAHRRFGLSDGERDAMLAAQGGCCAICHSTTPGGNGWWCLDHDHMFDKKDRRGHRGILCDSCNKALGFARDDPARLEAAARYLEAHRAMRLVFDPGGR